MNTIWIEEKALARTLARRPDLLKDRVWDAEEQELLDEIQSESSENKGEE